MEGTKIVVAWKEWLDSEEGRNASDPTSLGTSLSARQYLENRLNRAFHAGIKAAEKAEAEKPKS